MTSGKALRMEAARAAITQRKNTSPAAVSPALGDVFILFTIAILILKRN